MPHTSTMVILTTTHVFSAWLNMKFSPMVEQPVGDLAAYTLNWGLRSGTYFGDFREPDDELENSEDFLVDRTQIADLGSPNITPPIDFEIKFTRSAVDPNQDLAILLENEIKRYVSHI